VLSVLRAPRARRRTEQILAVSPVVAGADPDLAPALDAGAMAVEKGSEL